MRHRIASRLNVPTPTGTYNPDWTITMDGTKPSLCLIAEGNSGICAAKPSFAYEKKAQIRYGHHFQDIPGAPYHVVKDARNLLADLTPSD